MDEKEKTIRKIAKLLRKETIEDFCSCEVIADMIYEMLFENLNEKDGILEFNISKDVFNGLYHLLLDDLRAGYEGFDELLELINSKYKKYIDNDFDSDIFLMKLREKGLENE